MPQVTIRTILDGREESISEYFCDWPDCPNVAAHLVEVVREWRMRTALCGGTQRAARIENTLIFNNKASTSVLLLASEIHPHFRFLVLDRLPRHVH